MRSRNAFGPRTFYTRTLKVRAKKHLGQHFLTDLNIARSIAGALTAQSARRTLEVGPGTGVLTQFLLERQQNGDIDLAVVEIDTESVDYLREHYPGLEIFEGDFLKMDLNCLAADGSPGAPFNIIGNFPYNISSQIFFKVLDYKNQIPEVVGMVQREVAQRLASPPGNKNYGILSVLLQAYYDIEYLFTVHENVFNPPPKVKSAVIRLVRNSVEKLDCDEVLLKKIVKATFNHRRKTIRNSLGTLLPAVKEAVTAGTLEAHPFFGLRPETLSVAQFVELTNWAEKALASVDQVSIP